MPRFNRRFEVKREMSDGGKIRPDDDKLTPEEIDKLERKLEEEEFDSDREPDLNYEEIEEERKQEKEFNSDYVDLKIEEIEKEDETIENKIEERTKSIEIKLDEKGNPIVPEGWTFLIHGSSLDRWDSSLLGKDFTVGKGIINGKEEKGRALCCAERSTAKFDYERDGSNTAKVYGGKGETFQIRVLFYKNPRLGDAKIVREKLDSEALKDVTKYYMYQGGRHPAVPVGTKLTFLEKGNFDEITRNFR